MPIFWRQQLAIGHPDIDADHRYLILLINTIELVLRFPEEPTHIKQAFDELDFYARGHFEREEKIQIAWGYTHLDAHKVEHRNLMDALSALRLKVDSTLAQPHSTEQELTEQNNEITAFLRHWLLNHVLKEDKKMTDLFRKHSPHKSGAHLT